MTLTIIFIIIVLASATLIITAAFVLHGRWPGKHVRSALFVFAHPDDETMFFTPTIRALVEGGTQVRVLCLSTGQQRPGLRPRSDELRAAASILGISDVEVIDSVDMRDGMEIKWPAEVVDAAVLASYKKSPADVVVTFDREGVSSHLNHICTHHGVALFAAREGSPPCYCIDTVHVPRKFCSVVDVVFSWILSAVLRSLRFGSENRSAFPLSIFIAYPGLALVLRAMLGGHASQYVWFRWLYVAFSRYAFVNTLTRIN